MAQYLFRRNGQYYFRLRIPAAYRHHYGGKQEIRRTLGTHDRQVAIAVSAGILAELKKRFTHKDIDALEEEIRRAYLDPVLRWTKIQKGDVNIEIDYGDPEREKEAALALLNDLEGTTKQKKALLADVIAEYCKERTGRKWTDKTAFEARNIFNLLVEIVGNIQAHQLDYVLARYYKETLQQLPPNHRKKPRYRNLSIDQIIATHPKQTLSTHTINKHLSKCNALCDWMMRHGYVKQNFFKGLHIDVETRPDDERDVFTTEDLKKIFTPQKKYLYNYYYWLPRIAIFTGMRLNEICQLHTSDIYQKDSIWIFDVNKNTEDKRLKTRASKRLIPIHSRLIELGFIDFVKSKKGDRVFDELELSIDGYGRYPSRWFGRWKKKIGVEPPFHSFRHTVINHLKQKGINPFVIHAIDGHTEGDMSMDRYGKPYNVTILKDAIEQLDFDVPG